MVYAGFWRRFAAKLIDLLILFLPSILVAMILPVIGGIVIALLYWPFFESSALMGTPGKLLMGMVVTDESGGRLTFKQAMLRYLISILSGMVLCLGYFFNLFTPKRQTFHDIMAGAVVIERPMPANVDWIGEWTAEFKRVFNIGESMLSERARRTGGDPVAALENLHRLFQQGVLSEAEYAAKKEELLKKI